MMCEKVVSMRESDPGRKFFYDLLPSGDSLGSSSVTGRRVGRAPRRAGEGKAATQAGRLTQG